MKLPPHANKSARDPDEEERQRIREALPLAGGQESQAAESLGSSRTMLWRRMRECCSTSVQRWAVSTA